MKDTEVINRAGRAAGGELTVVDTASLARMMSKTRRIGIWSDRIRRAYFSDPEKRMIVRAGDRILRQNEPNDKLYYINEGSFMCSVLVDSAVGEKERLELFRTSPGGFVGVRSFFADAGLAVFDATAECDSVVTWMDHNTRAVDTDRYGSLREQFFPVIIQELEQRQWRLTREAKARVSDRIRLHKAEDMATLGQFAAGLAHELNNATSVMMSSSAHLETQLAAYYKQYAPELSPWFEKGMRPASTLSSADVRTRARELSQRRGIDYEAAKDIVRMLGDGEIGPLPRDVDSLRDAWMTGRSCRDIVTASRHAANIIHSIKQLSSGGHARREPVSVTDSIEQARELLRDSLKGVEVRCDVEDGLPDILGNTGELMQIWLNLMKNAYEAMRDANTPSPRIMISAAAEEGGVCVQIRDNGPGIPDALMDKLFQPRITTKSDAGNNNTMGLGLGLYIVKRLVNNYQGCIEVTGAPETCFAVHLPLTSRPPREDFDDE